MTTEFELLFNGPGDTSCTVVLAHGAGAPMDSPFMEHVACGLATMGLRVARFEFPYMVERRDTGKRKGPDRAPVLRATWESVIDRLGGADRLVIGGLSIKEVLGLLLSGNLFLFLLLVQNKGNLVS